MEIYKIKDLSFAYPNRETDVLKNSFFENIDMDEASAAADQ